MPRWPQPGRNRQVNDVSIDRAWLYRLRASEVESELLALASDPQAMVRRIRKRPT